MTLEQVRNEMDGMPVASYHDLERWIVAIDHHLNTRAHADAGDEVTEDDAARLLLSLNCGRYEHTEEEWKEDRQLVLAALRKISLTTCARFGQLLRETIPYLRDEGANYDDDGSNEPLELARHIEATLSPPTTSGKE